MIRSHLFVMVIGLLAMFCIAGCSDDAGEVSGTIPALPGSSDSAPSEPPEKIKPLKLERPVAASTGPWPKAVTEETSFFFGSMNVGTHRDHEFVIRNDGEADLELSAGKPTCKCTVFDLSKTTVPPGESSTLRVEWHGRFQDAQFQHGGPVYTNDPEREALRFTVKGIVDTPIDVLPADTWSVGELSAIDGGSMEAVILSRVHDGFEIESVDSDSPHVTTEVSVLPAERRSEFDRMKQAFIVRVTVDAKTPPGVFDSELKIKVDCVEEPMTVKVTAYKSGPIRILPTPGVRWVDAAQGLKLGQFSVRDGRNAELNLLVDESESTEPLEFTKIEATPSYISVELEPVGKLSGDKARYKMKISIPPGIPRTSKGSEDPATIHIETNHPSGQNLDMKVTYKALS